MEDEARSGPVGEDGTDQHELARRVREACVAAALEAYESAKVSGLCEEGAWEVAVGAIREVDLAQILEEAGARTSR